MTDIKVISTRRMLETLLTKAQKPAWWERLVLILKGDR